MSLDYLDRNIGDTCLLLSLQKSQKHQAEIGAGLALYMDGKQSSVSSQLYLSMS